jgi:hypothetical protein
MKLSIVQAIAWIVGSMLFVSGAFHKGFRFYLHTEAERKSTYVCRIVQTGPQREALKTAYLAELMQISADKPISSAAFNTELALRRLLASPVIQEATLRLHELDTVYIDYTVRQPVAWLYDFENIALDRAGYPFPIYPFFTPKQLPEIYLGIRQFAFGKPISDKGVTLALTLLLVVQQLKLEPLRLDLSSAFEKSLARREIVVTLDEQGFTKILRLTPKNYAQELGNYLELKGQLPLKPQVIDLRIPQLAFVE